jgi:hypothetical protein
MATIIQFPRKSLEDRMGELIAQFDQATRNVFTPSSEAHDRLMREYYRMRCMEERV